MGDRRDRLGAEQRARAAAGLAVQLRALPELGAASARGAGVAGFAAVRGEIDPSQALIVAESAGARLAFPRIPSSTEVDETPPRPRLRFHLACAENLRPGRFGIPEPEPSAPELGAAEIAVMLVPGLAFDPWGNRLGFGGGYYDEWLAAAGSAPPALVVGVGYDFQIVDACPAGAEDALVDCVVTEARVIRCRHARSNARSNARSDAGSDDGGKVDP